jgi:acetyl esterase/lipase
MSIRASRLTQAAGVRALLLEYRLAPEHQFPAALEDATLAYRWLLDGGQAELNVWPKMPHVFPLLAGLIPEGRQAVQDMSGFIRSNLGLPAS